MAFAEKYRIIARYLTGPSRRRPTVPLSPAARFVVAHDTGNPNSTAAGNVAHYERTRDEKAASAHLFVDDREILECIPALTGAMAEKAWHVLYDLPSDNQLYGHNANDAALGVEYCYGARIDADEAYRKYVWAIAYACHRFELDPRTSVVGHFFLDPQRGTDPVTGLAHSRRTYEGLLRDVVSEFQECGGALPPAVPAGPTAGRARTTVRLNIRKGAPSSRVPVHQTVPPGTRPRVRVGERRRRAREWQRGLVPGRARQLLLEWRHRPCHMTGAARGARWRQGSPDSDQAPGGCCLADRLIQEPRPIRAIPALTGRRACSRRPMLVQGGDHARATRTATVSSSDGAFRSRGKCRERGDAPCC